MMLGARRCSAAALVIVLGAAACGRDAPTSTPPPSAGLLGGLGLLTCTPLPPDSVASTIGGAGGVITVGPHVLTVPPGALGAPVQITAVIVPGSVNAVHFTPAGLTFATPAQLRLSYANCGGIEFFLPKRIAYVSDLLQILEYPPSVDDLAGRTVAAPLEHFSTYAVAW